MSTHNPGRTALYRYFDAGDRLLYVGISDSPKQRWGQHKTTKPWASEVAVREVEWFPTRAEAAAVELVAIRVEKPIYNFRDTPKMFPKKFNPLPLAQRYCGAAEVAKAFGVNRQRVQQLINRADFPAPTIELAMGKVWHTEEVRQWGREHGRLVDGTDAES